MKDEDREDTLDDDILDFVEEVIEYGECARSFLYSTTQNGESGNVVVKSAEFYRITIDENSHFEVNLDINLILLIYKNLIF
jgi:hypothetical protein